MQRNIKMAGLVAAGLNGQVGGEASKVVSFFIPGIRASEKLPLQLLLLHKQFYSLET